MKNNSKLLKQMNIQIECSLDCGCEAYEKLQQLSYSQFSPSQHMRVCYLRGKFLLILFWEKRSLRDLKLANLEFDSIFRLAMKFAVPVTEPKYWFKRVKCKYIFSQNIRDLEQAKAYRETALRLVDEAITQFPDNSSLEWIRFKIIKNEVLN